MLYTTRGLVIHQLRYADSSLIVRIFTERFGIKSYMFRGVFKPRSKFPPSLFQHLNRVELVADDRDYGGLQHPKEIRMEKPWMSLHTQVVKSSVCLFLNEVMHRSFKHEEQDTALFSFLHEQLDRYDLDPAPAPHFHLWFCLQLTRFLGFFPALPEPGQAHFNLEEGFFQQAAGDPQRVLDTPATHILSQLLQADYESLPTLVMDRQLRNILTGHLVRYFALHVEDFGEVQAHRVLNVVLG